MDCPTHVPPVWFGVAAYRIHVFKDDRMLLDLASQRPLPETREAAVEAVDMFKADYALILDANGLVVDRLSRSA